MKVTKGLLITVVMIQNMGATCEQVGMFNATFPDGAKLTKANLLKAADAGLDLDWFSMKILDYGCLNRLRSNTDEMRIAWNNSDGYYNREWVKWMRGIAVLLWEYLQDPDNLRTVIM